LAVFASDENRVHEKTTELANLVAAAEKACNQKSRKIPAISWAAGATGSKADPHLLI
jgi:hypothetical protein